MVKNFLELKKNRAKALSKSGVILSSIFLLTFFSFNLIFAYNFPSDTNELTIYDANITNFTQLLDSPSDYSGDGSKCVKVNAGETALEFGDCATGSGDITSVQGDSYIINGSNSGAVELVLNTSKLNETIDNRDSDSWVGNATNYYTKTNIESLGYYNTSKINKSELEHQGDNKLGINNTFINNFIVGVVTKTFIKALSFFEQSEIVSMISGNRTEIESEISGNISKVNTNILGNRTVIENEISGNKTEIYSNANSNYTNLTSYVDNKFYLKSNPYDFYNSSTIPDYILTSNEGELNVNKSDFWDNYDSPTGWDLDSSNDLLITDLPLANRTKPNWLNITNRPIGLDDGDNDTTYTNGSGLNLDTKTFSHKDTSSQSSSNNSGNTFIQNITLDTFGHLIGIGIGNVDFSDYTTTANLGALIVSAVGNWSADKTSYYTKAQVDSNLSNYILSSEESNLNVNSSNYWDDMETFNSTQMLNNSNKLNIKESWLLSLFYTKAQIEGFGYYNSSTFSESDTIALGVINGNISSWTSTYNVSYAGSLNNASYLSTYNSTYDAKVSFVNTNIAYINNTNTFSLAQTFQNNVTIEGIKLEKDTTNHYIYDNSTCIIIKGDTSVLNIC